MSTWYVSTAGAGTTGSDASPFALSYARSGAGGQILPGDTVLLHGGEYPPADFTVDGALNQPVTFQNYPGETPILTGRLNPFFVPEPEWELYDAPTHTWRTTTTYSTNEYYGAINHSTWGEKVYPLALHQGALTALMGASQAWNGASNNRYLGPGITARDVSGYIYCRIEQPDPAVQVGHTCPTFPSNDPNDYNIVLQYRDSTVLRYSGDWLVFDGLTVRHGYSCCYSGSGNNIVFRNMTVDRFGYAAFVTYPSVNITWDNISIDGNMDPASWWVCWEDIKNGNTPADHNRAAGFITAVGSNFSLTNSTIVDLYDGILGGVNGFVITDCTWKCWDDLYQMDNSAANVEIGRCNIFGAGPSHDSSFSGTEAPSPGPGKIYIHHNLFDPSQHKVFWGRLGGTSVGMRESITFPTHGALGANSYAQPWKVYHNTVISGETYTTSSQVGPGYYSTAAGHQYTSVQRHEVMNNIFISTAERACYSICDADDGTMVFDGNVYLGWSAVTLWPIWPYVNGPFGAIPMFPPTGKGYSAALFKTSQAHSLSQAYYPPGWEASGIDLDPDLDDDYRPQAALALAGAVDLTETGWPGTVTYEAFRGAFGTAPLNLPTFGARRRLRRRSLVVGM